MRNSLGLALVGLGRYADVIRVALKETKNCHLSAIVTRSPAKAKDWATEFGIAADSIYGYETFEGIANNSDVDVVYILLPNSFHAEYTIRAARAGKHVICEKPMAVTVGECETMILACKKAGRSLSVGYRLHFEPFNLEVRRLGQEQVYGKVKLIEASNGFRLESADEWRLRKSLAGGGALMDMGIYAVQAARYVTGEEPISVYAREFKTDSYKFSEIEETISWQMVFPSGTVADCAATYAADVGRLFVAAERGSFELNPAYPYSGLKGWTFDGRRKSAIEFAGINQQAAQLDAIADAIRNNRVSPVPGEEGLQDIKIIEAIYRSVAVREAIPIKESRA